MTRLRDGFDNASLALKIYFKVFRAIKFPKQLPKTQGGEDCAHLTPGSHHHASLILPANARQWQKKEITWANYAAGHGLEVFSE